MKDERVSGVTKQFLHIPWLNKNTVMLGLGVPSCARDNQEKNGVRSYGQAEPALVLFARQRMGA
jgi:hypothetical protein